MLDFLGVCISLGKKHGMAWAGTLVASGPRNHHQGPHPSGSASAAVRIENSAP